MDVVDVRGFEFGVAALPADQVPGDEQPEDAEGGGGGPVDEGVAEEEVFDDWGELVEKGEREKGERTGVVPAAHAEADVEEGPLPEL